MTITVSINSVGIVRATDMLQSARNDAARNDAARSSDDATKVMSMEIDRSVDAEAREAESDRPLPASQRRAVDIRV